MTAGAPRSLIAANAGSHDGVTRGSLVETGAARRRRFGVWHILGVAVLVMMLAFVSAAPARADLGDCIKAAVPVGDMAKAAELAGNVAACAGQMSDPVSAVTVATIAALVAAGIVPADTGQCQAVINSFIGQLVAQALIGAGLGAPFGQALVDLANGAGGVGNIPGLGQLLACGCIVAGAPGEAQKIADAYLDKAEGCADFFLNAAETLLNLAEDTVCTALFFVGGCTPAGGGADICYWQMSCKGGACPIAKLPGYDGAKGGALCKAAGYQCNACGSFGHCSSIPHAIGVVPGKCTCEPPYTEKYATTTTGYYGGTFAIDWLYACVCEPPNQDVGGQCFCPTRQQLKNSVCIPCTAWERYVPSEGKCVACSLGTKASAGIGDACVGACDGDKGEYLADGGCKQCPANTRVVYIGAKGGMGSCEDCPDFTTAPSGSTACTPLTCAPNAYADPDNPHACKNCPAGQIYIEGTLVPTPGASDVEKKVVKIAGHCGCPEGATSVGDGCACPAGAHLNPAGTACLCPKGMTLKDKTCVPALQQFKPPSKDCSALGPTFINDPKNAAKCVRCPGKQVANEARTACVVKPTTAQPGIVVPVQPGIKRRGDTWLNPQPEPPMLRRSCPPHLMPNARGTGCIPRSGPPQMRGPGQPPPGTGRPIQRPQQERPDSPARR